MEENGKIFLILPTVSYLTEMTGFFGTHNAKFDDKGRVVIPSAIKCAVPADQLRFVIRKDTFSDCLEMFTWSEWERQSEEVRSRLNPAFNESHAKFWRAYMHNCTMVEPDAKLGRISVPKKLLEMIGVTKEVVFSGNDYKIEIWAKEKFESSVISNEEFISIAGSLSDLR